MQRGIQVELMNSNKLFETDAAGQDVATLVELEHQSGGSRDVAQHLHALDRELQCDAAPKIDVLVLRLDLELDLDLDIDFGLNWFLARLPGVVVELLGSQRHDDPSRDHGAAAGQ
jgi:hypothetical protein